MKKILKVLLVDDENPLRAAVRYLLGTIEHEEFQILEARNGKEGYQMFCKETPDILLLDINMPQMSGIDLLAKLEDKVGKTKIIVISGYNDFQFVQKAIQYSVVGYLLKPVNKQEFCSVMKRAIEAIRHESAMSTKLLQVDKEKRIRFLRKHMGGSVHAMETYSDCVEELSKYERFAVCILRWNFNEFLGDETIERLGELDHHKIYGFIDEFLHNKYNAFCFESKNQENILFVYGYESYTQLLNALQVLQMRFQSEYNTKMILSTGDDVKTVEQIKESYRSAKDKIGKMNLLSSGSFQGDFLEGAAEDIRNKNLFENYKSSIRNCYIKSDSKKLDEVLTDFLNQLKKYQYCTVYQVELVLRQFIIFIDEFYLSSGEDKTAVTYLSDWQFKIQQICSFGDFDILLRYAGQVTISKRKHGEIGLKWVLEDIKRQLEENYSSQLKLDELADQYAFSKQYLNKMFKKEYAYPIHEYLLKIRMERAQYLLKNTSMDIDTVAASVGYSDRSYFGKVFKKYFNKSPNSYRGK